MAKKETTTTKGEAIIPHIRRISFRRRRVAKRGRRKFVLEKCTKTKRLKAGYPRTTMIDTHLWETLKQKNNVWVFRMTAKKRVQCSEVNIPHFSIQTFRVCKETRKKEQECHPHYHCYYTPFALMFIWEETLLPLSLLRIFCLAYDANESLFFLLHACVIPFSPKEEGEEKKKHFWVSRYLFVESVPNPLLSPSRESWKKTNDFLPLPLSRVYKKFFMIYGIKRSRFFGRRMVWCWTLFVSFLFSIVLHM